MNADTTRDPWTDPKFIENQRNFPVEKLWQYKGQHIAWSWDGSTIVAGAESHEALDQKLVEARIDPLKVIYDYVDDPEVSNL